MVLRYWGERGLTAESFAHLVDRTAAGIRTTTLIEDLRSRGWNAVAVDGSVERMAEELARGRPVITLIEDRPGTFHYIVIVASTPQAIVFHDPARSPYRVMSQDAFARRWSAADRWMAIVLPSAAVPAPPLVTEPAGGESACDSLIADGVRYAQANAFDAAERSLAAALSCGGSAPLRELAGLRLLQRRWPEVAEMATAALAEDPGDAHAWELLATSRFVQNDPAGALDAWNRIDQPRVDLVAVGGLTRTRQRVVEGLLAVAPQSLLTPQLFTRTTRRLKELPSAEATRLEFVPMSSGLAELRAHVVERPLAPSDRWGYVALALLAAAKSEIGVSTGALTGGGERVSASWRFWPGRPRVDAGIAAPAPWGGLWSLDVFREQQPFVGDVIPAARRSGAAITISSWVNSWTRVSVRGGVDVWDEQGSFGVGTGNLRLVTAGERAAVSVEGTGWAGSSQFASLAIAGHLRSTSERRGRVYIARVGGAVASSLTPADIWFAGDTGRARGIPLRAHPVVEDGGLRLDQMGRDIAHVSGEVQQWWAVAAPLRIGAALFADAVHVASRVEPEARSDLDVGLGARVAVPGLQGVFRIDLAKGLRDGATALSFVYEP